VALIGVNDTFLSMPLEFVDLSLSLLSLNQTLKNKNKDFFYQN
jgi:hypothetical protein